MAFFVGQKVVCIANGPFANCEGLTSADWPRKGQTLMVRGCRRFPGDLLGLVFEEIHNEPRDWGDGVYEGHFNSTLFRPVTDISTLQSIVAHIKNGGKPKEFGKNPLDHTREKVKP